MEEIYNISLQTTETKEQETNTECAFLPQKQKVYAAGDVTKEISDERFVKRSQTFSPRYD